MSEPAIVPLPSFRIGRIGRFGLFAVVLASALLVTSGAHAFCRTRTVPVTPSFNPRGGGCFDQGLPLFYPTQCFPYRLLAKESAVIPNAVLSNALARAFAVWSAPSETCSPGISGIELAPVNDSIIADYQVGVRGHNVVGVVQGPWTHNDSSEPLALATLTFNVDTGEIYDADLEIREDVKWSFGGTPPSDGIDLDAVLTHEVGHLLGLAHSEHDDAAMYVAYAPGSTKQRALSADDAAGVCAIYPTRQARDTARGLVASTACDLSPSTPGSTCGDPAIGHGCSTAHGITELPSVTSGGLAAAALALVLRWRKRSVKRVG